MSETVNPKITLNPKDAAIVLLDMGEDEQPKLKLYMPAEEAPQAKYMAAFMCWALEERDVVERFRKHIEEE